MFTLHFTPPDKAERRNLVDKKSRCPIALWKILCADYQMKRVDLIFPDTTSLAEFLLTYKPASTNVSSAQRTLSGDLSDDLIAIACTKFGAELKTAPLSLFFHSNKK